MFDSLLKWFVDGTSVQGAISVGYIDLILIIQSNCGSGLAREDGGTSDIDAS
jgi:hypothetical protein